MRSNLTLYLLCGVPASGKTTYAKQLSEKYGAVRYSYDDMPNAHIRDYKIGQEVHKQWLQNIKNDLLNGRSVVADNTSLNIEFRMKFLSEFSNIPCKKVLIIMDTPIDVCISRNSQRQDVERVPDGAIKMASHFYEKPSPFEQWDEIKIVKE